MGALSMTGTPKYREGFGGVEGVVHVAVRRPRRGEGAHGAATSPAIIVEPVQGEGGVLPAPAGLPRRPARSSATEHGALLLLDEVQTGIGRTRRAGSATSDAAIDAGRMSLAKGLGGGFPIGAMLTTEALAGALPPGTHGSTFGGNPLASAAARAVLAILEEEGLVAGREGEGRAPLRDARRRSRRSSRPSAKASAAKASFAASS